jgi:hypothetical protein
METAVPQAFPAKNRHNFLYLESACPKRRVDMRIVRLIFAGSTALAIAAAPVVLAALIMLAAPALAKHSNVPKSDDKAAAPPSCHAYEQAADGSWVELPCQEGSASQAPTPHKSATKGPDEDTR